MALVLALLFADPPVQQWHKAEVVSVQNGVLFRYFEIVDRFDPSCRLKYREVRNPFNPPSLKVGSSIQVVNEKNNAVTLIDQRGRKHKGKLALQVLMPPPPPPRQPTSPSTAF